MKNAIGTVHLLSLGVGLKVVMMQILASENYQVGDTVLYDSGKHEIVSIYSEASPLCGYVLLTGIGNPVLLNQIAKCK